MPDRERPDRQAGETPDLRIRSTGFSACDGRRLRGRSHDLAQGHQLCGGLGPRSAETVKLGLSLVDRFGEEGSPILVRVQQSCPASAIRPNESTVDDGLPVPLGFLLLLAHLVRRELAISLEDGEDLVERAAQLGMLKGCVWR